MMGAFGRLDESGDGGADRTEFLTQVMKDFASADHSCDGELK